MGDEFDIGKILVRSGYQITLRFNSFDEALKAFKCLNRADDRSRKVKFKCYFMNPSPNYYDGKMATQFETCIKDKFEELTQINELPANYIKHELAELEREHAYENEHNQRDGLKM